jgi:hypothetical protein
MAFAYLHSSRRALPNWQSVLRDLRTARQARSSFVKADGSYDLASIMREALRHARRYRHLPSWQRCMAVGLRVVWERAKAERLAGV